jgi:glycosyltransferase involved in cell wall biosynthesis
VSDRQLEDLYRRALCVITPALLEDYGLTAIEAMAHGKPVIACRDGGGLLDTVRDGENGLVVEPTGRAIAEAVERLRAEPGLRKELAAGALDTAARYTWSRAAAQLQVALDTAVA